MVRYHDHPHFMSNQHDFAALITNLETALAQTKDQAKRLDQQSQLILQLKSENEQLRSGLSKELDGTTNKSWPGATISAEALLLQNVQKQYEIDRLKRKLRELKAKIQKYGLEELLTSSSPLPSKGTLRTQDIQTSKCETKQVEGDASKTDKSVTPMSITKSNMANQDGQNTRKRKHFDVHNAAISALAEDGDATGDANSRAPSLSTSKSSRAFNRLDDLLSRSAPPAIPLTTRPAQDPSSKRKEVPSDGPHKKSVGKTRERVADNEATPEIAIDDMGNDRENIDQVLSNGRSRFLQKARLQSLSASHERQQRMKPSKMAVQRHRQSSRCSPSCKKPCCSDRYPGHQHLTLPARYRNMTENDILLQYLGHGSDDRIRDLTNSARENLLHEAKTKIIAEDINHTTKELPPRSRSPVGFWATDWPSQEEA